MTTKSPHYHAGFDYFTPDAGTTEAMFCAGCDYTMDVERNVCYRGGNSLAGPFKGPTRKVDVFTCPNSAKDWHDQVIALRCLQRDTPSQYISDLVDKEASQIISTQIPTKKAWSL